jgi:DNA invertase Pin-like site-specific DNA recombinase
MRRGDILVVARLDRLARSLSHLLSVIAELDAKGAHFKSLADAIDTATTQGRFALQVLGTVAELERAADSGMHQGRAARRQKTWAHRRLS